MTEALAHVDDPRIAADLKQQVERGERLSTTADTIERAFGHYRKIILPGLDGKHERPKRRPVE